VYRARGRMVLLAAGKRKLKRRVLALPFPVSRSAVIQVLHLLSISLSLSLCMLYVYADDCIRDFPIASSLNY
jgi:hypothetical protein